MALDPTITALHVSFSTFHTPAICRNDIQDQLLYMPTRGAYFRYPGIFMHVATSFHKIMRKENDISACKMLLDALNGRMDARPIQYLVRSRDKYVQKLDGYIDNTRRDDFQLPHIYDEVIHERTLARRMFLQNIPNAIEGDEFYWLYDIAAEVDAGRKTAHRGRRKLEV